MLCFSEMPIEQGNSGFRFITRLKDARNSTNNRHPLVHHVYRLHPSDGGVFALFPVIMLACFSLAPDIALDIRAPPSTSFWLGALTHLRSIADLIPPL